MALPALNNQSTIGNLSLDDKASIITSLVRSGKLQLANYGSINFNQTVAVSGNTATKESGGITSAVGETTIRMLEQIRDSIMDLSSNIINYLESSKIDRQVTQNLLEAQQEVENVKARQAEGNKYNFDKPFGAVLKSLYSMEKSLLGIRDKVGGDSQGGILSNILGSSSGFGNIINKLFSGLGKALGLFARRMPWLAAGYVLSQLPWGVIANKGKEMLNQEGGVGGLVEQVGQIFTGTESSAQESSGAGSQLSRSSDLSSSSSGVLQTAGKFEGMTEKTNKKELESFFRQSLGEGFGVSEAWCATFVNSVLASNGYKKSSSPKSAKSFLTYGEGVSLTNAKPGDIVVFNRGTNRGNGHVGFFVSLNGNMITILGGNQGSKGGGGVTRSTRKIDKKGHELVAIRRPTDAERTTSYREANIPIDQNVQQSQQSTKIASKGPENIGKEIPTVIPETGTIETPEEQEEEEETNETVVRETSSATNTMPQETASKDSAKGNAKQAFDYFSKYWTKEQAAAIVGNLQYESGSSFDPKQKQKGGGPGLGIAQWEPPRQKVFEKIKGKNIKSSTFEDQLEFVQWELTNTHKKAGNALKNAKSVKEATLAVRAYYETPGGNNNPNTPHNSDTQRIQYAQTILGAPLEDTTKMAEGESTNMPSNIDTSRQQNVSEQTSEQPQQQDTLKEKIVQEIKQAAQSITNIKEEPQAISGFVGEVAGMLGFDPKVMRELPKPSIAKLDQQKVDHDQVLKEKRADLNNVISEKKLEASSKQQQQPVVNINGGGGNNTVADNGILPSPKSLETRDPAILDLLFKGSITQRVIT